MKTSGITRIVVFSLLVSFVSWQNLAAVPLQTQSCSTLPSQQEIEAVRSYIQRGWKTLTRTHHDLISALPDPKMPHQRGEPWPLYISGREDPSKIASVLRRALSPEDFKHISIRPLPKSGSVTEHGLLYLPHSYVVPGGRFNEMYGWDSYFIQVGLLHDQELELARDMVDNFVYEIQYYGTILNANRTYFLTRSQPPFLTAMILGVFKQSGDVKWLRTTLPAVEKYYRFWTGAPHLVPEIGLSRYFDLGEGPAPEVELDERDAQGKSHYDRVKDYYRTHDVSDYDVDQFYDRKKNQLTALYYKGDRSMRESGFDPSHRFGPFNADIIHYAPVCLNSLLYQMERDAAEIYQVLGDSETARQWTKRAAERKERVNQYLWDKKAGLYFDYNFKEARRRHYPFATTFYPLWVGLASREQAEGVVKNLASFEAGGGLLTSTQVTGNQWDAPFGWAPLQLIAVRGLQRYGFEEEADRLAEKFVALVNKEFKEHGVIVEKYDVERCESEVSAGIRFGYSSNEIGFGWTNAVFEQLLPPARKEDLRIRVKTPPPHRK